MTQQAGCGRLLASLKFVFSFDQISQKETSNRSPSLSLSLLSLSYIYIYRERERDQTVLSVVSMFPRFLTCVMYV